MYFYMSGSPNKEILYGNDKKISTEYVQWRPFWILRFVGTRCHLQLGIRLKWIQHKIFIKKQHMKYFSSKMPTGLYLELYFDFLSWLLSLQKGNNWSSARRSDSINRTYKSQRSVSVIYVTIELILALLPIGWVVCWIDTCDYATERKVLTDQNLLHNWPKFAILSRHETPVIAFLFETVKPDFLYP